MIASRRNRGRMAFLLLLLSGHFATAQLFSGFAENTSLGCTNDLKEVFCQFKAQNCSEYSLTIQKRREENYDCPLQQCDGDQCCCSVKIDPIVLGQTFTGTVKNKKQTLESKPINIIESFKPRTPTIKSVKESDGNFEVSWTTNMNYIPVPVKAEVTFYKKGSTEKVFKPVSPAIKNELQYYEKSGENFDPGSTYVVCVRTFTEINKKYSDSSKEWEFKTPSSLNTLLLGIAAGLSVCAVIIVASLNGCYIKYRNTWSDKLSVPSPKVVISHFKNPPILRPENAPISRPKDPELKPIKVDGLPFAFIRAKHKPDPYKDVASALQSFPAEDQSSSGSSSIFNQTYSLLIPNSSDQKKEGDGSSSQRQSETLSLSTGSSNKSGIVTDLDRQTCLFPEQPCTVLPTKTLCQMCKERYITESSSYESKHSSLVTSRELKDIVVNELPSESPACSIETILNTPSFGPVPAGSHGFSPMDDNYQPFRCQVEGVCLTSGVTERPSDCNKYFNQDSESFKPVIANCFSLVNNGQLIQIPSFSSISNTGPIKVISDYHSV